MAEGPGEHFCGLFLHVRGAQVTCFAQVSTQEGRKEGVEGVVGDGKKEAEEDT